MDVTHFFLIMHRFEQQKVYELIFKDKHFTSLSTACHFPKIQQLLVNKSNIQLTTTLRSHDMTMDDIISTMTEWNNPLSLQSPFNNELPVTGQVSQELVFMNI